jgi:hypothetical protein
VDKEQFMEVTVYRPNGEAKTQSRMVDMSPTGVGILHPYWMESGTQFSMTIVQPGGQKLKFLYNAIYCNPDKSGAFHVGAEFVCAVPVAA